MLRTAPHLTGGLVAFAPALLPAATGLNNLGATCWFNAVVQALLSCPAVADWLRRGEHAPLASELRDLAGAMRGGAESPHRLLQAFRTALRQRGRQSAHFSAGGNESACEGLALLAELLEAPGAPPDDTLAARLQHDIEEWVECGRCGGANSRVHTTALHFELFGQRPRTPEEFAAALHCAAGPVTGYRCERCGSAPGVRYTALRRVREVLTVLFNAYGAQLGGGGERYYPQEVVLPVGPLRAVYRAVAAVEHSGGLHGGHYWCRAVRRTPGGCAHAMLNDATVQVYAGEAVPPAPAAYLVFYHFAGVRDAPK